MLEKLAKAPTVAAIIVFKSKSSCPTAEDTNPLVKYLKLRDKCKLITTAAK